MTYWQETQDNASTCSGNSAAYMGEEPAPGDNQDQLLVTYIWQIRSMSRFARVILIESFHVLVHILNSSDRSGASTRPTALNK
jgi:hypothetical protein